jgi:hypothetical protein
MKKVRLKALAIIIACAAGHLPAQAVPPTSEDPAAILESAVLFSASASLSLSMRMEIREKGGLKEREILIRTQSDAKGERTLVIVRSPAFLSKLAFLRVKEGGSPMQWLRSSSGVKRLGGGSEGIRLFDSHFSPSDLIDPASQASGALLMEAPSAGILRLRAKGESGDMILDIDEASRLILSISYLDGKGRETKRYRVLERDGASGRPSAMLMEDSASGGSTTLRVLSLEEGARFPASLFSPGSL